MEIPQNTVSVGLVAPISCRSVFRIWRTNASRLVAGPGIGSVLVVGGVMALVPRPCQQWPSGSGSGSPRGVGPAVPTREAWRPWQGPTTVAIPCAEVSNPGSSGSACPAERFQVHSTHELLAALFVFYTLSPNNSQDILSP